MRLYLGNKNVVAAEERPSSSDGSEGFRVVFADGLVVWMPRTEFLNAYKAATRHERILMQQHDDEHQVAAISDGEGLPDNVNGACDDFERGRYSDQWDDYLCKHCNISAHQHSGSKPSV